MKKKRWIILGVAAMSASLLAGCETFDGNRQTHHASNLYEYLYSGQKEHVDTPTNAVLSLPLRVGIVFVPAATRKNAYYGYNEDLHIPESQKVELMKQVSAQFKAYPFVKSIEIIPSEYVTPQGGFANLDQLRTIYGVDVMTLLSYDQVQFTGENILNLTYWTVVGAYLVPAEKNDTRTMMDAAVYDIASRKLLFRAPGISSIKAHATLMNETEDLRADSEQGFSIAATNLAANLQIQLAEFKERVTNSPAEYTLTYKPGYSGAGAFGGIEATGVAALGACFLWTRRNRKI